MRASRPIAVYLRDHETAAQAGVRAFRRVAGSHRSRPWGSDLVHLASQVRDDLRTEQRILRARRVRRRRLAGPLASIGERLGRLKGNGAVVRRSPTTDVVELEALIAIVAMKRAHWRTLELASIGDVVDATALVARADAQLRRLVSAHEQAAAALRGATRR